MDITPEAVDDTLAGIPISEDRPREHVKIAFPGLAAKSAAGRLVLYGEIKGGRGIVPALPFRVYGSYAIVYIMSGQGHYRDANGRQLGVTAGDLIYVFPELPHTYGPDAGTTWDEYYIVFDGPAAASLREWGVITPTRPIVHLKPVTEWLNRLQALTPIPGASPTDLRTSFFQLLALLGEVDARAEVAETEDECSEVISTCCRILSRDLVGELTIANIADECGVPHSTLRRQFHTELGVSMHEFRTRRRIEAAGELLRLTSMTNAQIAARLGYSDEYHFSKQYKLRTGATPRQTRSLGRAGR